MILSTTESALFRDNRTLVSVGASANARAVKNVFFQDSAETLDFYSIINLL